MARGDKKIYNQQQQQAFANATRALQQDNANQQTAYGQAYGGYAGELAAPGFSDAEKQAMRQAVTGSLAGAFGAARNRLLDHAARTGNNAGLNFTEEELARDQGRQNAQDLGALEGEFGQARIQGAQNALAGLGGLYGTSSNAAANAMNNASNLVGTQGRVAMQPGFWSRLLAGGLAATGNLGGGR